jgi:hypothetical protein
MLATQMVATHVASMTVLRRDERVARRSSKASTCAVKVRKSFTARAPLPR